MSSCVMGWPVIHWDRVQTVRCATDKLILASCISGGVQGVRMCNGLAGYTLGRSPGYLVALRQIDPGWLYIEVESTLSGCATVGLLNSDRLYTGISPVTHWN